jgi:hypothetical protein
MGYSMWFLSMMESYIESFQNNSDSNSPTAAATIRTSCFVNKFGSVMKSDHYIESYIFTRISKGNIVSYYPTRKIIKNSNNLN